MSRTTRALGMSVAVMAPVLLTACTTEVVAAPELSGKTATTCQKVLDQAPRQILGVDQHDRVAGVQAQWGEPSLVLTCGVEQSDSVQAWSACSEMEGLQLYIDPKQTEDPDSAVTVHTLGTNPVVRLDVPGDLRPKFADVIAELAPAIRENIALVNKCQ